MKTININLQAGLNIIQFPDGQPHVNIPDPIDGEEVRVICSITSPTLLFQLLQTANAIDNGFGKKSQLVIPYLMGARYDRKMQDGDSIDLVVISDLINSMKFEMVSLYDVHSDTAAVLIKNSININNWDLVNRYDKPDSVLICPDAGAVKKVSKYLQWNSNLLDVVYCTKTRDLSNGNLTIKVLEPEKCEGKNCVIIDDLCDGGGTFLGIAGQINPGFMTLIVSHGIFSQGFDRLAEKFDRIITSDSYPHDTHEKLETVKWA